MRAPPARSLETRSHSASRKSYHPGLKNTSATLVREINQLGRRHVGPNNGRRASMEEQFLIEMKDLSKTYAADAVETQAVRRVDLSIKRGTFLSFMGPSGCGKSTLLAVMGLLDSFSGGHYRLNGIDTAILDRDAQARIRNLHIGFIFQSFNLINDLTVAENVALPLRWRGDLDKAEIKERAHDALNRVDMGHRSGYSPAL